VWAEPSVVERAAWEFGQVDDMLRTAEALFGPYAWERFDILTMPPSFPYGGMENPRLTFLTPTLLAGDRSLVSVVAHELAHSWTGNLVSNASAEHFWLNEGVTVFAERRILEALEGTDVAALQAALGRRELDRAVEDFQARPELTRLRTNLAGVDPDEAFSVVPYEKGYLFLRALEDAVGREAFDAFLRGYVERFRFRSITSEEFLAMLDEQLPGATTRVGATQWVEGTGIPASAPVPHSNRLEALRKLPAAVPSEETVRGFHPTEWQLFLESLPHPAPPGLCAEIDEQYHLTRSSNYEVLVSWLVLAARSNYTEALPRTEDVLRRVGRMKYLRPLYQALARNPLTREFGWRSFTRFRDGYHPIARQVIENIIKSSRA
jgi:hypothetical protein